MHERRRHERFRILADILIIIGKEKINCVAFDVSLGGMSFVSMKPLKLKSACEIYIARNQFHRDGTIVSEGAIADKPGMKKYGVQFSVPISQHQLTLVLEGLK